MAFENELKTRLRPDQTEEFVEPAVARVIAQSFMGSKNPIELSLAGWIYKTLGDKIFAEACFHTVGLWLEQKGLDETPQIARIRFADWIGSQQEIETAKELLDVPVSADLEPLRQKAIEALKKVPAKKPKKVKKK